MQENPHALFNEKSEVDENSPASAGLDDTKRASKKNL